MQNFESLNLPARLNDALAAMQFTSPTPIQAQAVPLALEGHDILGSAATGTGKTGAFGIPLVAHLMQNRDSMALVLTPTRELAQQVAKVIDQLLGHKSPIKSALLIGGDSMLKQIQQLKAKPRVIIGTPGRVNDHLKRRTLNLEAADMLVLDETDRMLDMGFGIQIDAILAFMPGERQTMMFSATLPKEIVAMSQRYMQTPKRVSVGESHAPTQNVEQEVIRTTDAAKYNELLTQLEKREGSIIVFVKTKYGAEKLALKLIKEQHSATAIHGDLRQHKREKVINAFRNRRHRILVATDVAARGLDIPHIEHVINFDLPQCPEDYIHRIGRTARAGAKGQAVSLLAPADGKKWSAIYRMLNPNEARPAREDAARQDNRPRRHASGKNSSHGAKRSFGKPYGDKKPYGEKRSYGDKPAHATQGEKQMQGEKRPYSDKPRSAKPYGDKPYSDKPSYGKSSGHNAYGDKPRSDKPRSEKTYSDKPYGEKRASADKPHGKKYDSATPRHRDEQPRHGKSAHADTPRKSFKSNAPRQDGARKSGAAAGKPFRPRRHAA